MNILFCWLLLLAVFAITKCVTRTIVVLFDRFHIYRLSISINIFHYFTDFYIFLSFFMSLVDIKYRLLDFKLIVHVDFNCNGFNLIAEKWKLCFVLFKSILIIISHEIESVFLFLFYFILMCLISNMISIRVSMHWKCSLEKEEIEENVKTRIGTSIFSFFFKLKPVSAAAIS